MAVNLEIREKLPPDTIVFDNYAYDNSIIGITFDGRAIYEYYKMIAELVDDDNMSADEAIEWIDYNTIRSLSYINGKKPLVVCDYSYDE